MSRWKPGEPVSARKLNAHSAELAGRDYGGAPGSMSTMGSLSASQVRDLTNTGMWIRVYDQHQVDGQSPPTQTVYQYSWEAMWWDDIAKRWKRNQSSYGNWQTDPATSSDGGTLTVTNDAAMASDIAEPAVTPYFAARDPVTRRLIVQKTASGGTADIKSNETVLMILGTYDEYKDCPGAPPKPPVLQTTCGEDTTDLCVPAYAFAVYQRCGYIWKKIGDSRTTKYMNDNLLGLYGYGVWANELNGGSTSAFRRFVIPRWGGSLNPVTGLPDPSSNCMGVAFIGSGASALTCTCPTCLSSPPEGSCLQVRFQTMPRPVAPPENPFGCVDLWTYMDANSLWDTEVTIPIDVLGCTAGTTSHPLFDFEWQFFDVADIECDWGPDEFDPCDPCRHWGRIQASIGVSQGGSSANCGGAGQWTGEFLAREICDLLCDCGNGPISPVATKVCKKCGNTDSPPSPWWVIKQDSVKLECCPP